MSNKEWIVDVRVGCVAVHENDPEKYRCLDGASKDCIFYRNGYQVYNENGLFDHWAVYPEDVKNAYLISASKEMYDALKMLWRYATIHEVKGVIYTEGTHGEWIEKANEALKKAEGNKKGGN